MRKLSSFLAAASAALLVYPVALRASDPPPVGTVATPSPAPSKTGKERLSDKASDEQRVDNCKVSPERQGTKPRPSACPQLDRKAPGS